MRLLKFYAQRTGLSLLSLFGAITFIFFLTHFMPGNPLIARMTLASPEYVDQVKKQLGLDRPLSEQYVDYLGNVIRGDLGKSWVTNRQVIDDFKQRLPSSLELAIYATLLAILIGIPLGIISAVKQDSWIDQVSRVIGSIGVSTPAFWLGLILIYFFYFKLEWAAAPLGRLGIKFTSPEEITGIMTLDTLLAGDWPAFRNAFAHVVLPAITLAIVELPIILRITRTSMIEALQQDYITTARAVGLPYRRIIMEDALKNSMISILTVIGMIFAYLVVGSLLVERVFSWPGIGLYTYQALVNNDYAAIQAFIILTTLLYISINWIVDILYGFIDPRIRT
jgi:ABC-type dipeptide/oligopeptide/nickel transport system permease component